MSSTTGSTLALDAEALYAELLRSLRPLMHGE